MTSSGGLAGACASRAPRLHDNLVFAGSRAIPEASRPFLLPPPPRQLSPVTWPGSAAPTPWRLRVVLLERHLEALPHRPALAGRPRSTEERATLSLQRWASLWLALKASPPSCPVLRVIVWRAGSHDWVSEAWVVACSHMAGVGTRLGDT